MFVSQSGCCVEDLLKIISGQLRFLLLRVVCVQDLASRKVEH
jgi:hypothetical protein